MNAKTGTATKIIVGVLLAVIVCMGAYIVHLTRAANEQAESLEELQVKIDDANAKTEELSAQLEAGQYADNLQIVVSDLTEEQLLYFETTSTLYVDNVLRGEMSIQEMDNQQNSVIEIFVMENELPANGINLFQQWKNDNNFYNQFKDIEVTTDTEDEQIDFDNLTDRQREELGILDDYNPFEQSGGSVTPTPSQGNKPKPSQEQQHQAQQNQSSSSSSGGNTNNSGTSGDYVSEEDLQWAIDLGGGGGSFEIAPPPPGFGE